MVSDEDLASFDLSDFETAFAEPGADKTASATADASADELLAELGLEPEPTRGNRRPLRIWSGIPTSWPWPISRMPSPRWSPIRAR